MHADFWKTIINNAGTLKKNIKLHKEYKIIFYTHTHTHTCMLINIKNKYMIIILFNPEKLEIDLRILDYLL